MIELLLRMAGRLIDALPLWAIGALLSFAAGGYAYHLYVDSDKADAVSRAIDQANDIAEQDQELFNEAAETRTKIEVRYRTIIREVPVVGAPPGCDRLGVDYFRVFNDAIRAVPDKAP